MAGGRMDTQELFKILVKEQASDLIIKANACPAIRVQGRIKFISESRIPEAFAESLADQVLPETMREQFQRTGEADTSYEIDNVGRFRANIFRQRGRLCLVFRSVLEKIPSIDELNLPKRQVEELAALQRGLVLITGTTGSGKSTTMAAMIEFMNHNYARHIITVEDPIEFTFVDRKSMINQREIGFDTLNYAAALRHIPQLDVVPRSANEVDEGRLALPKSPVGDARSVLGSRVTNAGVHTRTILTERAKPGFSIPTVQNAYELAVGVGHKSAPDPPGAHMVCVLFEEYVRTDRARP